MPRPLAYSTPQRQAQYQTIRSAGLDRAEYRAAIAKLNKAELKYRENKKKKEDKQKEQEEKRRAEEQRKKEELDSAQKKYIDDIISNMRGRNAETYNFKQAEALGISAKRLLEVIARNSGEKNWVISLDGGSRNITTNKEDAHYFTLNDNTRTKIFKTISDQVIQEQETENSDQMLVYEVTRADNITVRPVETKHKNQARNARFFKYHNKTDIDLSRYGIWRETNPINYDDTCLIVALRNGGVSAQKIETIKHKVKNRSIPFSDLPAICDAIEIQIRLKTDDSKNDGRRIYGKQYNEIYTIGCLLEHYFIVEPTIYTSYSIKNYNELKDVKDFNKIYNKLNYKCEDRYIDSFSLIKTMLSDVDTFFTEISVEDKFIASTQFYDKVSNTITHLEYNKEKCVRPVEMPKKNVSRMVNVFFDFETNPNGEHKPYLCRTYDGTTSREFIGDDCGLKMLFSLKRDTRLIAHNATYDFRFLITYLRSVSELARGNRLISAKGMFSDYKIEIKDSYHLISMPLRNFPKVFGIENHIKEVMPYTLYTQENIDKRWILISDALNILDKSEHEQFLANIERWNLRDGDTYDIIKYSSHYCEIDCILLYDGYFTFRKWIKDSFKLDIDNILTGASLAHQYFIKEGCYEGVNELGGIPQFFIQGCVVGGRVMTSENKKIKLNDVVNDFDAVSLYPSAMYRMDGFLKGAPKVIENLDYNWIKEQDGYFIDIVVNSVGTPRKFPLMSYKNDNGVRMFSNDMVGRTIRVDKYTLEDLIKFQNITFTVVRGYYFDEGFNTKVRNVITTIFNKRLEAKKQKNPVEMVYKLIMNSGYGKSIMKPVETESRFFDTFNSDDKFEVFLSRNYNWITSYVKFGNKVKVNLVKTLVEHFNIAQVGVCILSNSKRIMNEVMCLAEDSDIDLYYQDTDSIHLKNEHISKLANEFKRVYGRELIGKGLGQFHSDFDLPGCSNVVATKSIFLGKKCYIDKLEGVNAKGEKENGYHIRMKGIPEKCIHYVVENTGKYKDVMDLYEDLYNGNEVAFDLTNGGTKANFKFNKDYTINTLSLFSRSVKF